MDGVCRPLGSPAIISYRGRVGFLYPLTLWKIGVCEQYLLGKRRTPADAARDTIRMLGADGDAASSIIRKAHAEMSDPANKADRYVTHKQFQDWINRREGLWFTGWLCLRKSFKEFRTPERSRKSFGDADDEWVEGFARLRDAASGTDVLSNMEWPSSAGEKTVKYAEWKKLFRFAASEYGFTKEDVGRWTLWDYRMYTAKEEALGGTRSVSAASDPEHLKALAARNTAAGRRPA